ncbi:hypothetical protein RJ639_026508 [Escallonia herrerae]|uniref:SHSP domain-containing protein n=1 Tax=Escallonia herrerae TaxID=1293975 RepID=A0AA88SQ51_9ASTE|nr:hypothetical protein RJ639_026508 [Escallonia herrerae]
MEVELGFKLTKFIDDLAYADILIAKDGIFPIFLYRESDTMFILTCHLEGYRGKNIQIEIKEDGTRIEIRGEKATQEMITEDWKVRGFRKTYKIPDGFVLEKIKAKFNEDKLNLTILMPKLIRGTNVKIEEMREEECSKKSSESLQIVVEEVHGRENEDVEEFQEPEQADGQFPAEFQAKHREDIGKLGPEERKHDKGSLQAETSQLKHPAGEDIQGAASAEAESAPHFILTPFPYLPTSTEKLHRDGAKDPVQIRRRSRWYPPYPKQVPTIP